MYYIEWRQSQCTPCHYAAIFISRSAAVQPFWITERRQSFPRRFKMPGFCVFSLKLHMLVVWRRSVLPACGLWRRYPAPHCHVFWQWWQCFDNRIHQDRFFCTGKNFNDTKCGTYTCLYYTIDYFYISLMNTKWFTLAGIQILQYSTNHKFIWGLTSIYKLAGHIPQPSPIVCALSNLRKICHIVNLKTLSTPGVLVIDWCRRASVVLRWQSQAQQQK